MVRVPLLLFLSLALNSAGWTSRLYAAPAKRKAPVKTRSLRRPATPVRTAPAATPQARAAALQEVQSRMDGGGPRATFVQNPAALIPFFEQLRRLEKNEWTGVLPLLAFGDSHTAADEWTDALRQAFQQRFGDGGNGFSMAGRIAGYRRFDVKTGNSIGWAHQGLLSASSDGLHGIAGVSFNAHRAGEATYVTADASRVELHYWRQPGGGAISLLANGQPLQTVSTDGPRGFGFLELQPSGGAQRFEVQTLDPLPVRLLGWVTEKNRGVTVEPLGINGAQVGIFRNWNSELLTSQVARRNPGLILLAYGTNEAANRDLTYEGYKATVSGFLKRLRQAAPTASILVLGPPDRMSRTAGGAVPFPGFSRIVQAQRDAARENNCAFWDLQERMGGVGSLQRWVTAGAAQWDYVHFTSAGYRLIGATLFNDLMDAYVGFQQARQRIFSTSAGLTSIPDSATATATHGQER